MPKSVNKICFYAFKKIYTFIGHWIPLMESISHCSYAAFISTYKFPPTSAQSLKSFKTNLTKLICLYLKTSWKLESFFFVWLTIAFGHSLPCYRSPVNTVTCAWVDWGVGSNDPCTGRLFCSQMSQIKLQTQPQAVRPN